MKFYSEALKRGPPAINSEAYKLFSNRAACFTKLGAYPDGLKDAEECIALKPDFPKGYSRKGLLQFFMKDYDKAIATYQVKYPPVKILSDPCTSLAALEQQCTFMPDWKRWGAAHQSSFGCMLGQSMCHRKSITCTRQLLRKSNTRTPSTTELMV